MVEVLPYLGRGLGSNPLRDHRQISLLILKEFKPTRQVTSSISQEITFGFLTISGGNRRQLTLIRVGFLGVRLALEGAAGGGGGVNYPLSKTR